LELVQAIKSAAKHVGNRAVLRVGHMVHVPDDDSDAVGARECGVALGLSFNPL